MKKFFAIIVCLIILISNVGCSSKVEMISEIDLGDNLPTIQLDSPYIKANISVEDMKNGLVLMLYSDTAKYAEIDVCRFELGNRTLDSYTANEAKFDNAQYQVLNKNNIDYGYYETMVAYQGDNYTKTVYTAIDGVYIVEVITWKLEK